MKILITFSLCLVSNQRMGIKCTVFSGVLWLLHNKNIFFTISTANVKDEISFLRKR